MRSHMLLKSIFLERKNKTGGYGCISISHRQIQLKFEQSFRKWPLVLKGFLNLNNRSERPAQPDETIMKPRRAAGDLKMF